MIQSNNTILNNSIPGENKELTLNLQTFSSEQKILSAANGRYRENVPKLQKIVGETRHYPPANKEWRNSIYAFNKNNIKSLPALDKMASKTIKSYFNLSNNKKLARSRRMRNLIRRSTVKRLFVSRPEIKQTSDKVNVTVYTFDREKQFLLRKMYFYNRNMYIHKDIYLYKLWLRRNLLAFKKTFTRTKSVELLSNDLSGLRSLEIAKKIKTNRNKKNKTYIHNILLNKYYEPMISKRFQEKTIQNSGHSLLIGSKVQGHTKALSIQSKSNFLGRPEVVMFKRNLIRSLKQRNIIRSLKKREMKKGFRKLNIAKGTLFPLESKIQKNRSFALRHIAKNYFANKVTRKVRLILRNKHNIFKIKQKLKKLKRSRFGKIRLPYSNLKFKNEIKFFSFRLVSELKYIRKLFFYYFIKYVLSLFQIKIKIEKKNSRLSRLIYEFTAIKEIAGGNDTNRFARATHDKKKRKTKFINRYSSDKLKNIEKLNIELLNFLKLTLAEGGFDGQLTDGKLVSPVAFNTRTESVKNFMWERNENKFSTGLVIEKLDSLYKNFESKYFLTFLSKFFKKEFLYLNYYSKFLLNQLKFGKFLPGLKLLISKIYSKKVELNLVNLKYPHLNSDIYTDSIATKLRKKIGLLRVLRWSLKLARLPYKYYSNDNAANLNKLQNLNIHKSLDLSSEKQGLTSLSEDSMSKDRLDVVLNKLFPYSLARSFSKKYFLLPNKRPLVAMDLKPIINNKGQSPLKTKAITAKSISVLNIIRYKWVSGVRLEAAGRLTRRYTAARSVFKFRYKGNLKNIDYSQKTDTSKKNVSTVMLRNYVKSNSQYSFTKSKRRIGAFGLKGWISSY